MLVLLFFATVSNPQIFPITGNSFLSMFRDKSPLISSHLSPLFLETNTLFAAKYNFFESYLLIIKGASQFHFNASLTRGLISILSPVILLNRINPPYCHWL